MIKQKTDSNKYLWLLFLLACSFIIRIFFLESPLQADDTTYFKIAEQYSSNLLFSAENQLSFRYGFFLPLHGLQAIFGYSIVTYYIYSISMFLFLMTILYVYCLSICELKLAILAVAIASTSALVLNMSSILLTSVPNFLSASISFLFFFYACSSRGKKAVFYIFLATVAGFYSYTIRMPNTVLLIFIPLYEILSKKTIHRTFFYGIIFFFFIVCEILVFWGITGEPLIRFKMISNGVSSWNVYMPDISTYQYLFEPISNIWQYTSGKILFICGFIGFILASYKKNWSVVALAIAGMTLFLLYSYSIKSIDPLKRALPLDTRYVIGFSIVMSICTAYLFYYLNEYFQNKKSIFKFFNLLVILSFIGITFLQIKELPQSIEN